jgi:hypothetical protein
MNELKGQMSLFTLDGCTPESQAQHADEVCACEGIAALSLANLITEYGEACAELTFQNECGTGTAVINAENYHAELLTEFTRRGLKVTHGPA